MSIVPTISLFLTHLCNIKLATGRSGAGEPVLESTFRENVPCRFSNTQRIIKGFTQSEDVVRCRGLFFIAGNFPAEIKVHSQIVYSSEIYEVISADKFSTDSNLEIHHWELLCR